MTKFLKKRNRQHNFHREKKEKKNKTNFEKGWHDKVFKEEKIGDIIFTEIKKIPKNYEKQWYDKVFRRETCTRQISQNRERKKYPFCFGISQTQEQFRFTIAMTEA